MGALLNKTGVGIGFFSLLLLAACQSTESDKPTAQSETGPVERVDCSQKKWVSSNYGIDVNYAHIFCGELNNRGRVVGLHARPQGINPETVTSLRISQEPNAQGIYAVRWAHKDAASETKFSTFFPDYCSISQVINSVAHAAKNTKTCPRGAPNWAWCGPNAPSNTASDYCLALDGKLYTIAGASSSRGGVNTAFPLR